jgi:hypothetical protein
VRYVGSEDTGAQYGQPTRDSPPTCKLDALCKNSMLQDVTKGIELTNLDWIHVLRVGTSGGLLCGYDSEPSGSI